MLDATSIIDYSYNDYIAGIKNIVSQIKAQTWEPDFIIGIARGGAIPAVHLSHQLKKPVSMLNWSSRDSLLVNGNESLTWIADDINCGKRILLVDDIVDGGDTIRQVLDDWQSHTRQKLVTENIKIAALFYNEAQPTEVDFFDRRINRDEDRRWVVFPWEV